MIKYMRKNVWSSLALLDRVCMIFVVAFSHCEETEKSEHIVISVF
jgi:hypothetical protein